MIHTYAVEPELVATWGETTQYRYFVKKFGLGTPRALAEFPKFKNWKRRVLSADGPRSEIEQARVEELVKLFEGCRAAREEGKFDGSIAWIENAEREHAERPFDAIVASKFTIGKEEFLRASDLGSKARVAWDIADRVTIGRKPKKMAAAVAGMLRNCSELLLIDPHFSPTRPQYLRTTLEFLKVAAARHSVRLSRVEIHCKKESQTAGMSAEFFRDKCQEQLPRNVPSGLCVRVFRWIERGTPGSPEFHDRFILTDLGGVEASRGLDDDDDPSGPDGTTTRFSLLSPEEYSRYWELYNSGDQYYDTSADEAPCEIEGLSSEPRIRSST